MTPPRKAISALRGFFILSQWSLDRPHKAVHYHWANALTVSALRSSNRTREP
jgi:hypothetical protein